MKKFVLSSSVVVVFVLYVVFQRFSGSNDIRISLPPAQPSRAFDDEGEDGSVSSAANAHPASVPPAPVPIPHPTVSTAAYKDGSYTGSVADAYYGNVQVKVAIQSGRITDVQFLDYPRDRRTSVEINTQAMPQLKQEAIQIQSANVDVVSGATQTSGAFRESLASALARARN